MRIGLKVWGGLPLSEEDKKNYKRLKKLQIFIFRIKKLICKIKQTYKYLKAKLIKDDFFYTPTKSLDRYMEEENNKKFNQFIK